MIGTIVDYSESDICNWCEKEAEGVVVQFEGKFLQQGHYCNKCCWQAIRVYHKQTAESPPKSSAKKDVA